MLYFKVYKFLEDVETTKATLFKKNMRILTETLKRQNEAERILLDAMDVIKRKKTFIFKIRTNFQM